MSVILIKAYVLEGLDYLGIDLVEHMLEMLNSTVSVIANSVHSMRDYLCFISAISDATI